MVRKVSVWTVVVFLFSVFLCICPAVAGMDEGNEPVQVSIGPYVVSFPGSLDVHVYEGDDYAEASDDSYDGDVTISYTVAVIRNAKLTKYKSEYMLQYFRNYYDLDETSTNKGGIQYDIYPLSVNGEPALLAVARDINSIINTYTDSFFDDEDEKYWHLHDEAFFSCAVDREMIYVVLDLRTDTDEKKDIIEEILSFAGQICLDGEPLTVEQ